MFYLVRHGQTDYSERNTKIYQGFGTNMAPLSQEGIRRIKETARDKRLKNASLILSSPYTRALQTAAILSKELNLDIIVETELHEWVANKNYIYETEERAIKNFQEYMEAQGHYNGTESDWEDIFCLRERLISVLSKYTAYEHVIVVCHGTLMQAVSKNWHRPENGEIMEYVLEADYTENV